ncbi:uncharacterized protein PV09_09514 [Verruconis gallopava]|uniref:Tat pathway signal sequence n=1 Tax=Verruconis gallopava TaxID=253628 RepID=A0A0D1YDC1_9PEZI|nr:uncharacterized protein PV09_09514 [Verruconis gallopava]KIV98731.1 hypothetical protein PV09_09514 [Verruconis gallopava]
MGFKYQSVPLDGESDEKSQSEDSSITLNDRDELSSDLKAIPYHRTTRETLNSRWLWTIHAVLLSISFAMFVLSHVDFTSTLEHVRRFSAWSPADVSVKYSRVQYNFSTDGTRFIGKGPAVDKAWREISYDMGDQWISKQDMKRLGMPEWHLQVDHPRTGERGYRVGMEVFHHLHCLNLLRRVTYKEYYQELNGELAVGEDHLRAHTDHCIEVLRHHIMCNADIGLFSLYMVDGDPQAWPELNTNHVCRDFDSIRQWALENSVGNMEVGVVNDE